MQAIAKKAMVGSCNTRFTTIFAGIPTLVGCRVNNLMNKE